MKTSKIIWTITDEAPALATCTFLPIIQAYTKGSGIEVEISDISLVGRIIANFPDKLSEDQRIPDCLTQLGELAAEQALLELATSSFGAVQSVKLLGVEEREEEGEQYAVLRWRADSLGVEYDVAMVILPEFLAGAPQADATKVDMPAWLTAQMAGYISEQVLAAMGSADEDD